MKSSTGMSIFMLFLALGSLAIMVHGGKAHAREIVKSEEDKVAADLTQPEIDPQTLCDPSTDCAPQPWRGCYRCIVNPKGNPPFLTPDECKTGCPIPPAHA
uniref:Bowman-Birk serine protease inhibitors family domain-containing protein n=1 Tax=Leersia perrieri TaxID=77586 RepID=A0A0D9V2Q5_9ORYZ